MDRQHILENQDHSHANLRGISLGGADLKGKTFFGADLSDAHLGGADLTGADLRDAKLNGTNLGAAILRGADLRGADLRGSNLSAAVLLGADMRDCLRDGENLDAAELPALMESPEYTQAREAGYLPLAHWGQAYRLEDGDTLYRNKMKWFQLKRKLAGTIFGDRRAMEEVKLVKQYDQISQWAYMMTRKGFEEIATRLGLKVQPKQP